MHALIISDLHLGARNCQHRQLLGRLSPYSLRTFTHVLLNGDVVDHLNFEYFQPCDWAVIHRLQQLAREERLVVIQGNHDRPKRSRDGCISRQLLGDILNVELKTELTLYIDGQRYLMTHGDQYDQTLNMTTLGCVAEAVYRQTQRWHQPTSRWLKRKSKSILGIEQNVRNKALNDAFRRGFDGIILGHTHYAHQETSQDGLIYFNSGSWVDDECTFLELQHDRLQLKLWNGESVVTTEPVWSIQKRQIQDTLMPELSF